MENKKQEFCPGKNLETLLEFIEQDEFECLMMEPSLEETAEILRKSEPHITKEEILQVYKHDLKIQVKNRRNAEQLFEYGSSREETLDSLRGHVNYCKTCFNCYMNYLTKKANYHFNYVKDDIKLYNAGLSYILKLLDEDYLKLLD